MLFKRSFTILIPFVLFVLGSMGFNEKIQAQAPTGLYAAFLTQDGHIRTVTSDNGDVFKTGEFDVIHVESSDFGPGISARSTKWHTRTCVLSKRRGWR